MAYHDALTDLPNRRLLYQHLQVGLLTNRRTSMHGALIVLGLDRFKGINDALGHKLGDELLQAVVQRMHEESPAGASLSRIGGDEFGVLLHDLAKDADAAMQDAGALALQLAQGFARPLHVRDHELVVGVSLGVTTFPQPGADVEDFLRQAGMALHQAKLSGRNKVVTFAPSMQHAADRHLALEHSLRQALLRDEFDLHYQPQVDVSGRV